MKKTLMTLACGATLLAGACKTDTTHALAVSEAYAYAPLTADSPGVAYFTLTNNSNEALLVSSIVSRCFARAELHRSVIEDGVNRMVTVSDLNIAPGKSVRLSPAGLHLMLIEPNAGVAPGSRCEVLLTYGTEQVLTFEIELLDRKTYRPAEPVK